MMSSSTCDGIWPCATATFTSGTFLSRKSLAPARSSIRAQALEPFLVRHAEVLLLVDDHQAEVLELDGLAEQRVGADHDIDLAVGDALLYAAQLRRRHQPRRLSDLHRKTLEPLGEGL